MATATSPQSTACLLRRRGKTQPCRKAGASQARPSSQNRGVLGRVFQDVNKQAHDALLACAKFGERLDAHRVGLRCVMVYRVCAAMRLVWTVRTFRSTL